MLPKQKKVATEIRQALLLSGPLVLAQLAQVSLGFIDTVMVGRLGGLSLAGVALGSAVFFPLFLICMGFIAAVSPMVSQSFGAGREAEIGPTVRQGLWLATMLAVLSLMLVFNVEPLLRGMGQEDEVVDLATGYLHAIAWGFPPALWLAVLRNFLEGLARPRPVMVIAFIGVGINIIADYTLMFGKFGFPALGVVGTGWASTAVFWGMFIAAVLYIRSQGALRHYGVFTRLGRPDPTVFRDLFRIGWPIGVMFGIEVGLFAATAMLMGLLGPNVLASHQIAIQCAAFTFMVPVGLALATTVRVGQAIGREDVRGARRAGYVGMGLGLVFMSITALCFWLIPQPIVALYINTSTNPEVTRMAVALLGIAAFFQVFDGLQVTAAGALRGLKDTRIPMLVGLVTYWGIGMTSGYFLGFHWGWGGKGLWWGLVLGLASAGLLLLWRFKVRITRLARMEVVD